MPRLCCTPSFTPPSPDRVENEHIGNVDQYRVTREMPLPYSLDTLPDMYDDDDDDDGGIWFHACHLQLPILFHNADWLQISYTCHSTHGTFSGGCHISYSGETGYDSHHVVDKVEINHVLLTAGIIVFFQPSSCIAYSNHVVVTLCRRRFWDSFDTVTMIGIATNRISNSDWHLVSMFLFGWMLLLWLWRWVSATTLF